MKLKYVILLLSLLNLKAENEINLSEFANLIGYPGLPLESIDYTARESKIRNIDFKRVLYLKVADRKYIYPAMVYIAPKGSIDSAKYDKMRNLIRALSPEKASNMMANGFLYLPEIDNAVASIDQIKMTRLVDFPSSDREEWIDTNVGGFSITCSSDKLGFDCQIFLTGDEEQDTELVATYKKEREDSSPDQLREVIKELIQLVRVSPLMAAQVKVDEDKQDKGTSTFHQDQNRAKEKDGRLIGNAVADKVKNHTRHTPAYLSLWPWLIGLSLLIVVVLIYRFRCPTFQ